jgi:putative transposase
MSNHVQLVAVPESKDALARSLKQTHGRFASYWNAVNRSSGHVWQGRYYSCPLDDTHLWEALRYTELNPVRACLVRSANDWPWSSAAAHCGTGPIGPWLSFDTWGRRWSCDEWQAYLDATPPESNQKAIRDCTFSGRPLGSAEFTHALERQEHRPLTRRKPGPKKRSEPGQEQFILLRPPLNTSQRTSKYVDDRPLQQMIRAIVQIHSGAISSVPQLPSS